MIVFSSGVWLGRHICHNKAQVSRTRLTWEQKSREERKGKSLGRLCLAFVRVSSMKVWPSDPLKPYPNAYYIESRGDRKITTGITGLWLPRVPIDGAF